MTYPDFKPTRYKTFKAWGDFPANTECWAARINGVLTLTFDDGTVFLPGPHIFCAGIDVPYEFMLAY